MARPAPRAVIFDCDGTLVDSEPLSRRAWEASLVPHGYELTDVDREAMIGHGYAHTHAYLATRVGDLPGPEELWATFSATFFTLIEAELVPFEDAIGLLEALVARGVPVAVASSSRRERLDRTLRLGGLEHAFAVSIAGDEVQHGKPAPDMFLEAARRLGVAPGACAVIEDSAPGVAAGRAAGMWTVAVARSPADAARLGDADVLVERLDAGVVLGP